MAENGSDSIRPPAPSVDANSRVRRTHTYSRLTTALAVLALATAVYGLVRLDSQLDRMDQIASEAQANASARESLRTQLNSLADREQRARVELEQRIAAFADVPRQVQELANTLEELRGRTQGPERAWSRAEAMYLLELAQRRLTLNRDVETAIVALEAADARLASLRDTSFAGVRQQIARDLQALRAVPTPDIVGISAKLASIEERAMHLPVRGINAVERSASNEDALPKGFLRRAWAIVRNAAADLVEIRKIDDTAGGIVTREEALLRREHLQLLLFSARSALARHDVDAYRGALASARTWLAEMFDLSKPGAQAVLKDVQALEPIQIDPPLPDLTRSSTALRKLMPMPRGPE